MRVLLDTNIIIHRENYRASNYSVGSLYNWLEKLKYTKIIHPLSKKEILDGISEEIRENYEVKLSVYNILKTIKEPNTEFLEKIKDYKEEENDVVDNVLLFEVYIGRVDLLITEDRKMLRKATSLGIRNNVFSINSFIEKVTRENPSLLEYNVLSVKQTLFGEVNLNDSFFDSFRSDYKEFDSWFNKKCDEIAYICVSEDAVLGFLYVKVEGEYESYADINPVFSRKKRLKIGTFKVESTGFRLGERFIKIIIDNAVENNVEEIYVTLFDNRDELQALKYLLYRWGFRNHGYKNTENGKELVLVKDMLNYDKNEDVKYNYPLTSNDCNKYILPIFPKYHTTLLPDSILNTESSLDIIGNIPHRYALQKVYISWADTTGVKKGDILLFYRNGPFGTQKRYSSVLSTLGIVDEIITVFQNKNDFLSQCQNRSVFKIQELNDFWSKHRYNISIIKFVYLKKLNKRPILNDLYNLEIIPEGNGPRPFTKLSDIEFKRILELSNTDL